MANEFVARRGIIAQSGGAKITGSLLVSGAIDATGYTVTAQSFTGSLLANNGVISSSTQVVASLPIGTVSSSAQYPGWVTSSAQIDYNSIQNKLSGVVSSSTQIQPLLPDGTVSSSAQVTANLPAGTVSSSAQVTSNLPTGTISSSTQFKTLTDPFTGSFTGSFTGDGSQLTGIATVLAFTGSTSGTDSLNLKTEGLIFSGSNGITATVSDNTVTFAAPAGTVSASSQIDYNSIQNKLSGVVSSSSQVKPLLPADTVSSSTQVTAFLPVDTVSSSAQIQLSGITGTTFATADFTFPQNLTVGGTLTAEKLQVEYVTSSIIYESGSTKFGDTADDTHQFTGSVLIQGPVSASAGFTGSFKGDGSQLTGLATALKLTGSDASTDTVDLLTGGITFAGGNGITTTVANDTVTISAPLGTVSGSAQVKQLLPADTVSSSTQVKTFLPDGSVSSSAQYPGWVTASSQVDITATTNYTTFSSSIATKNDSQDAAINTLSGATGSYALQSQLAGVASSSSQVKAYLPNGTVSSSAQYPGWVTSSTQVVEALPIGTVSSSAQYPGWVTASSQISITATTGYSTFSSSLATVDQGQQSQIDALISSTGSYALQTQLQGVASTSAQVKAYLPDGSVSSSAQYPGWVTASSQVNITSTTGYSTFSSSIATKNDSQDAAIAAISGVTGSYATTGSNNFVGAQTISNTTNSTNYTDGALVVDGGVGIAKDVNISGSLTVTGLFTAVSMSTQYVTSSQYTVGTSRVIVNDNDLVRFAGLSVIDSGSTYGTGSLLWDSLYNRWIYQADDQNYNSAVIIAGPQNAGALGNEVGLTVGRVPVATGDDHIDSRPESSSIRVDFVTKETHIESGLYITGSVTSSVGFKGDGSQLTGIVTTLAITGSDTTSDTVDLKTSGVTFAGGNGITTTVANDTVTISAPLGTVSSSGQVKSLLPDGTVSASAQYPGWVTASSQVDITATTNYSTFSSSIATKNDLQDVSINVLNAATSSYALQTQLQGVASSSAQVKVYLPTDTVSSSAQVKAFLPADTVSSSGQVDITQTTGYSTFSSSLATVDQNQQSQINALISGTGSYALQTQLQGVPSTSGQVKAYLPDGTVSSSAQYPGWVTASSQIQLNAITGTTFSNASFLFPQDLTVGGTLTAERFITEYISSSIIYESGSTKFGDSADDVMSVTGSIKVLGGTISGSLVLPTDTVSSSAQVKTFLPDGTVSSSAQYPGWVTSSTQIVWSSVNYNSGIVSSSTQIQPLLPTGTVSSSAQYPGWVTSSAQVSYTQLQNIPSGIVSSSTQFKTLSDPFTGSFTGSFVGDGSNLTGIATVLTLTGSTSGTDTLNLKTEGLTFSGSNGITAVVSDNTVTLSAPAGTVTSSGQVANLLPAGTVSSSTQFKTLSDPFTGSFTGSFVGDGSGLTNLPSITNTTIDTYTFVGDGATSIYDIVKSYYGNSIIVTVDGLTQIQTTDYTLVNNILTFVSTPPSESNILVRGFINATEQSTGSFSGSFFGTITNATSASYALTASYAANAGGLAGVISSSTQFKTLTDPFTGSFTGSFEGTLPYTGLTGVPTLVSASSQIQLNAITGTTFSNASFLFPQDLTVAGTLTAEKFITEYISSSIIYESGSTKFGDSADDVMSVTGSIQVLGTVSASSISGSFFGDGSNLSGIVTNLNVSGSGGGTGTVSLKTQTLNVSGSNGIVATVSGQTLTISGSNATTTTKGVASFTGSNFTVSGGAVSANPINFNGADINLGGTHAFGLQNITPYGASTTDQITLYGGAIVQGVLFTTGSGNSIVGPVSNQIIASVSQTTYDSAQFDYIIKDGTNFRSGTVISVWNGATVEFTDISTADIGDTVDEVFTVDAPSGTARLKFSSGTGTWTVKVAVRAL